MEYFLQGMVFIFGAIIGSFLNVVIYRLHTGRSLSGRSHCMSCGKELAWYELFPILSYLYLRGTCSVCTAYIPSRYLVVELLTGGLFLLVWFVFAQNPILLVLNAILVSVCVVMLVYDIRHMIIPDELTLTVCVLALALVGYDVYAQQDVSLVFSHIIAGVCTGLFFWGLWYVSKGRWIGFGDVKLAIPFGCIVGTVGAFSMVVFSFWIGAIISLSLLCLERLLKRGKVPLHFLSSQLTIKSEVPFAPFFIAGFLLVQLAHVDIFVFMYAIFLK